MLKPINDVISFVLELAMLAAFGYAGFHLGYDQWQHYLLGICIPVWIIIFWAKRMAPKAKNQLPYPWLLIVTFILFEAAAAALYFSGSKKWAIILGIAALINVGLRFVLTITDKD